MKKITISDQSIVREKVLSGISQMASIVAPTLGPNGGSVIMERGQDPFIIDDGRRIAENILLDDPVEQMAVKVAYSVTRKTDEKAGDGTTTSMVLAHAILKEAHESFKGIGKKPSVSEMDEKIQSAKSEVLSLIDKESKPVKSQKDLLAVANTIAGNDEVAKIVSDMYWKLGKDSHITIEMDPISESIQHEIVKGYQLPAGYAAPWMITDPLKKVCKAVDAHIFVTNQDITEPDHMAHLGNLISGEGKSLIIVVAKSFAPSILEMAYNNAKRPQQPFYLICVKPRNQEMYKDLAVFSGAKYFTENDPLSLATVQDFGYVRSVEIGQEDSVFVEGRGRKKDIESYIKELETERDGMKLNGYRQQYQSRISSINGQAGVIKIGAPTEEAKTWLKYKVEDTIHGVKHAMKDGIIPGGGLTFKKISEKLPEGHILKKALLVPFETLKANGVTKVDKDVFDATISQKAALEYACSAVGKLVRITGAITHVPIPTLDEAFRAIMPKE